jgi:hypothetical protein
VGEVVDLEARVGSWARGKEVQRVMSHQRNGIQMKLTTKSKAMESVISGKGYLHECYTLHQ